MHFSYHQFAFGNYPFLLWGLLVLPLLLLSLMILHHWYVLYLLPHLRFQVLESRLKVHTRMMVWPFPCEISYVCKTSHFFHTFYIPFLYFLDYILHYIPPHICILLFHCQCLEFYMKQTMLFFLFIIFFEDIIIIEGFDSLGLLQNMLQPFIKSHPPL